MAKNCKGLGCEECCAMQADISIVERSSARFVHTRTSSVDSGCFTGSRSEDGEFSQPDLESVTRIHNIKHHLLGKQEEARLFLVESPEQDEVDHPCGVRR